MRAHDRGNIARIQADVLHMRRADTGRALKDKAGQEDADKEQIEPGTARGALPAFSLLRFFFCARAFWDFLRRLAIEREDDPGGHGQDQRHELIGIAIAEGVAGRIDDRCDDLRRDCRADAVCREDQAHDLSGVRRTPAVHDAADHRRCRPRKAEAQQHAAQIKQIDVRRIGIEQHGRDETGEARGDQPFAAESRAQRAEKEIHDGRCDIAAAVIDREKAALDAEGLGDGREIEAFTAAAEAETDKDHQEACGDNDPAIPLRGDLYVLHQTPLYGTSSSR